MDESKMVTVERKSSRLDDKLIEVNNLDYPEPLLVSVANERNIKNYTSANDEYKSGREIVIHIPTGSMWVDTTNSWLTFTVQSNASAFLSKGGSALDLFAEVIFVSRTGDEVFKHRKFNIFKRATLRWQKDYDYLKTKGGAMGLRTPNGLVANPDLSVAYQFAVPLCELSDLFASNKLIPPYLMSGSRLRICLASAQEALVWAVDNPANDFTVSDVSLNLDTTVLSDSITRKLLEETSKKGLNLTFENYSNAHQRLNSSVAEMSAQKAVGRACKLITVTRTKAWADAQDKDSLAPEPFDYSEFRTRIGNLTFPDKPTKHAPDMYLHAHRLYENLSNCESSRAGVTYDDFLGNGLQDPLVASGAFNSAIAVAQFCRSEDVVASGLPTNKSQGDAIMNIRYKNSGERDIDTFLTYDQELIIGVQNLIIEQ
jgi:hypothetical protein